MKIGSFSFHSILRIGSALFKILILPSFFLFFAVTLSLPDAQAHATFNSITVSVQESYRVNVAARDTARRLKMILGSRSNSEVGFFIFFGKRVYFLPLSLQTEESNEERVRIRRLQSSLGIARDEQSRLDRSCTTAAEVLKNAQLNLTNVKQESLRLGTFERVVLGLTAGSSLVTAAENYNDALNAMRRSEFKAAEAEYIRICRQAKQLEQDIHAKEVKLDSLSEAANAREFLERDYSIYIPKLQERFFLRYFPANEMHTIQLGRRDAVNNQLVDVEPISDEEAYFVKKAITIDMNENKLQFPMRNI